MPVASQDGPGEAAGCPTGGSACVLGRQAATGSWPLSWMGSGL